MCIAKELREIIIISKQEMTMLRSEGFEVDAVELLGEELVRVSTKKDERENMSIALGFIREKTKGYGTSHILELEYSASSSIEEVVVDFKGLMKLHQYVSDLASPKILDFAALKHGDRFTVYFNSKFGNTMYCLLE